MTITSQFRERLTDAWPLASWCEDKLVVAVSGGADSTALLDALVALRPDPTKTIVAHFNHGLRGEDSDDDQIFVETIAKQFALPCVCQVATMDERENQSENYLRNLRRNFLVQTATELDAKWIVLAHHADDQVETFLHNLLRGSGPRGLAGMRPSKAISSTLRMIRPMLHLSRRDILAYLDDRKLPYRVDASNALCNYTRNRIRHELLPLLRSFSGDDSLDRRLLQACDLIAQQHAELEHQALCVLERWRTDSRCVFKQNERLEVPAQQLHELGWPILQEVLTLVWHEFQWPLREMSLRHWKRLEQVILFSKNSSHPTQQQLPGGIVVSYRQGVIRLVRAPVAR